MYCALMCPTSLVTWPTFWPIRMSAIFDGIKPAPGLQSQGTQPPRDWKATLTDWVLGEGKNCRQAMQHWFLSAFEHISSSWLV